MVTATYCSSLVTSPVLFSTIFVVGFGIGKGLAFPSALKAGWSILPDRKGFVSGFIICGIGFGSFVWGIICNRIANPNNVKGKRVEV